MILLLESFLVIFERRNALSLQSAEIAGLPRLANIKHF
jgi:hypothetical protein